MATQVFENARLEKRRVAHWVALLAARRAFGVLRNRVRLAKAGRFVRQNVFKIVMLVAMKLTSYKLRRGGISRQLTNRIRNAFEITAVTSHHVLNSAAKALVY